MARPAAATLAHNGDVAHQGVSRRGQWHQNLTGTDVRARFIRIGHRHHHGERCPIGTAREPLVSGDHELVALAFGPRGHHHRIRPGVLRLRHREAAADFAARQWLKKLRFLFVRPELQQQLHVADVRRLTITDVVAERCPSEHFAQARIRVEREIAASERGRQERRPQTEGAGLLPELFEHRFVLGPGTV